MCNLYKIIKIFYDLFFHAMSLKSGVYFSLAAHLNLNWPYFKCLTATWGQLLWYWTAWDLIYAWRAWCYLERLYSWIKTSGLRCPWVSQRYYFYFFTPHWYASSPSLIPCNVCYPCTDAGHCAGHSKCIISSILQESELLLYS